MRWLAGILLVGAAVLKVVELFESSATSLLHPLGSSFVLTQIGAELAVGCLILSGIYWLYVRWFAVVLFAAFAAYSFYLAVDGAASCGCFGPVKVNPWWTFALDAAVMSGLLLAIALERRSSLPVNTNTAPSSGNAFWPRCVVAVAVAAAGSTIALLARDAAENMAIAGEQLASVGDMTFLEPEKWIGEQLPIAASIDLDLSQGSWIVLLHRHDCSACREQVPLYEMRASQGEQIALVEVPPYGHLQPQSKRCRYGRLTSDREWFVKTPVELQLEAGVVVAAKTHEH